jgi:hypothetical protein
MRKLYRMIYRKALSCSSSGGIDARYLDSEWTKTNIIFKSRDRNEAMNKAKKFWERGDFGMGSIDVEIV